MEQVFEMMGFNLTVITPSPSVLVFTGNKPEPYFIAKEMAKELGYKKADNLVRHSRSKGLEILTLTKNNGLDELKSFINKNYELLDYKSNSLIHEFTPSLLLLPGSSLHEYLLKYEKLHKAKEIADKLYKILSESYTVQPTIIKDELDEVDQLIMKIYPSHSESIEVSKKIQNLFAGWYFKRVFKTAYLRRWNRSERIYNWLMSQSLGFYFFFHWRYNQSKFNSQQKQDSRNLLYFAVLRRPANFKAITTP